MARSVKPILPYVTNCRHKGLVVEIIGPAGAGKSTLYKTLGELDLGFVREPLPPVWDLSYVPFFVINIISLVPVLLFTGVKGGRRLTREELAWMAMLNGWPELLKHKMEKCDNVILLDQGPIFLMGTLFGFGPPGLQNIAIQRWWKKIFERWMKVLDVIVWLDSSDEILTTRIRTRDQSHSVKEACDQDVQNFLAQWRKVYEQVMNKITLNNQKLQVVGIDSGQYSVDEIVYKVVSEIDNRNYEPL